MENRPAGTNGPEKRRLDELILELNGEGLSSGKIAKELFDRYEIRITKSSVGRRLMKLRQDPDNNVKVNFKIIGGRQRTEGKWYNVILKLKKAIPAHTNLTGNKPSSRTMVYQFIDDKIITPNDANMFTRATVEARLKYVDQDGKLFATLNLILIALQMTIVE